ncbi:aminotransferase class III-fold pyridoxal phosphate-dependent enzyme [Variovorax sp. OV700]|uniref:aminotransferase class III-fold pyridoxal phosphate-dependent enzyme n=1 Tax=Variovorax sp. OV700 TaxID=1882826 RepID=UPI00088AC71D|nr:aminotransferase class III-fold pyridoxal phosphate-dependent enzyme [Variovorax sp. OV700]SDH56393.1 Glutamate-1-semialdehyde aminotransferase [Variovorax sp. OV700]
MTVAAAPRPSVSQNAMDELILREFSDILGLEPGESIGASDSLMDMGADSLALMKCIDFLEDRFGVSVSVAQVYQEFATVGELMTFVRTQQAGALESLPPPAATVAPVGHPVPAIVPAPDMSGDWIQSLMTSHVALMDRQLQILERLGSKRLEARPVNIPAAVSTPEKRSNGKVEVHAKLKPAEEAAPDRFNVFEGRARSTMNLGDGQAAYLSSFIDAFSLKHRTSKERTQDARKVLADNRASAGFRPHTKELLFPILAERAEGAHLWDVDGNRFVDITMGFGVHLFGHNPDFIRDRLTAQVKVGFPIGPQSPLSGRVATLLGEMTGHERVVFCNSGTEATMTAVRIARATTGRRKIAIFRESYHGTFDGFLARSSSLAGDSTASQPVSAGVVPGSIEETVVLEYGDDASLEKIQAMVGELAAVVVEPVQSRRPWLQPKAFLARLRDITRAAGVIFIWDEVITGFRVARGGAQEIFGIRADLATYGKIVGGGMPIGLVAGDARLLDVIDGGFWRYGDNSAPQVEQIFFAGTFSKHPLAMAASVAALERIQEAGSALYEPLNRRTEKLAQASNALFEEEGVAIKVECFGSLFRYVSRKNIDLFFTHLMMEGVYIWEGRNCFLSTAHSDADLDFILEATRNAIRKLQDSGFLERRVPTPHVGATIWQQRFCELWNPETSLALNIGGGVFIRGLVHPSEVKALGLAVAKVVGSCADLFVGYERSMNTWVPSLTSPTVVERELARDEHESLETAIQKEVDVAMGIPFSHSDAMQCRLGILTTHGHGTLLTIVVNHAVCDGYSLSLLIEDIMSVYVAEGGGAAYVGLAPNTALAKEKAYNVSQQRLIDQGYWSDRLAPLKPVDQLARPSDVSCGHLRCELDASSVARIAKSQKISRFAVILSAFQEALNDTPAISKLGLVGVPVANRSVLSAERSVAQVTNLLPLIVPRTSEPAFARCAAVARALREMTEHSAYPVMHDPALSRQMPIALSVNLEPSNYDFGEGNPSAKVYVGTRTAIEFPVEINIRLHGGVYRVNCDYQEQLVDGVSVSSLTSRFESFIITWSQHAI